MKTFNTTFRISLITIAILAICIHINAQTPIKRPLIEEYTGTWCSSCAFGSVYFAHTAEMFPNAIPVAIHSGDIMEDFSFSYYMSSYYDALPTFLYDRVDFPTNSNEAASVSAYPWVTGLDTLDHYLSIQYNQLPIATVGIDQYYDANTREISVDITANFVEDATGEFRLNCFILEDSVTGGTAYNQSNSNFSGWTGGPAYLLELINSPPVIVGYNHNHVARAMLGTPEGATASIPDPVVAGSSYTKTFTYTIPADYDEGQISLVGVIQRYGPNKIADRNVVNALSQHLDFTVGLTELDNKIADISIYPNPINANSTVEFYIKEAGQIECSIYNMLGQKVADIFNKNIKEGEYSISLGDLNLNQGIYLLSFNQKQNVQTERIVIQ